MGKHKGYNEDLRTSVVNALINYDFEVVESQKPKASHQFGESKQLGYGS